MECYYDHHTYGDPYKIVTICGPREWCERRCDLCGLSDTFYRVNHWREDRWEPVLDHKRELMLVKEAMNDYDRSRKIEAAVNLWLQ
jgi:hypothetical protein